MCERELVQACGHAHVSVEQAWPRLIAASYLVVTGLIKDDELTFSLPLSNSLLLSLSCFWHTHKKIASSPPLWVVFGEERRIGG